jgi:hypothetical protein
VVAAAARALGAPAVSVLGGETIERQLGSAPDQLAFTALPGEVVSVTVVPAREIPGFVPTWRIADVQGRPVRLSNGEQRCAGRCETAPLPDGALFVLRIADTGPGQGAYVATLEAVSATANGVSNGPPAPACARTRDGRADGTRALEPGTGLEGTIDGPGEADTFTLLATAGEVVRPRLVRTGGDAAFAPMWVALDARGTRLPQVGPDETAPIAVGGVVTVLVADGALRAARAYTIAVQHGSSSTTTSTIAPGSTTSTTSVDPVATTTTSTDPGEPSTSTTEPIGTTTTATAPEATSTTTTEPGGDPTTTSTIYAGETTTSTTGTLPGSTSTTTTTLAPELDLAAVVREPSLGPRGMLGTALAESSGHLVIGAPHEDVGSGRSRIRDAGAVLVVDVAGLPGSPTFGRVIARLVRPGTPVPGDRFGAAVAPAGDDGIVVGAPGARTVYVFESVQEARATTMGPPGAAADDGFGSAVVVAGDLVVVGAPEAGAGAAYVFDRATGAPRGLLTVPGLSAGARLGAALAASGSRVLVGAPGTSGLAGAAFLFDATTGALVQELAAEPPVPNDAFGAAVAFAGNDPVVGAPGSLDGQGRVVRFDAVTGNPARTYLAPSPRPQARFGAAVGFGQGLLVVGAPGDQTDEIAGGAAYTFDAASGMLVHRVQKPMPQERDGFGTGVVVVGSRIAAGAPGDDAGTVDGGVAYLFEGDALLAALRERLSADGFGSAAAIADDTLYVGAPEGGAGAVGFVARIEAGAAAATASLVSPEPRPTRFGAALAIVGSSLVVGAPEASAGEVDRAGRVYVFTDTAQQGVIENPAPGAGDQFGFALGALGGDVLVSAPFAGAGDTGLVYRVDAGTGRVRVTYGKTTPAAGDFFGAAVAGDAGQVLVGVPLDASGGAPTGAVHLFEADTAAVIHTIVNPSASQDLFGAAVALGQWIVVGAPLADDGLGVVGTVWVFDRATGALVRRLENPRAGTFDNFGAAVALMGADLVVGAPSADDTVADAGLVHLFDGATGQLRQTFRNPPQGAFDRFGFTLAADATSLVVGSPGPARVYLFDAVAPVVEAALVAPGARALASEPVAGSCGNGLVEAGEDCDDGNAIDTDDCRNDCTRGPCCTLDAIAPIERCDDGNACTRDLLDAVGGCRYEADPSAGCCETDADCGAGQECRVCVGCFIYHWDCCDVGSRCVAVGNPVCAGKSCIEAAYCLCEGKLACTDDAVPDELRAPFASACDTLRLQSSVAPDGTLTKPELVLARQRTRSARAALRKTLQVARVLARDGALGRTCRKQVVGQVREVRRAIPRGKRLRRCLAGEG